MATFIEWRAAQQTKTDAERIQLMRTGETEAIKPVREKLERYVNALAEYVAKEQIPPLGEGPDRIHLMPFRTQNECGWAIEMFPFRREACVLSAKRFEAEPKLTRHDYRDDFENCFKEAQEKNYYIEIADDAQKLLYWFTVFTGKGIFRHEIKMGDYNNLSREQLRAQGFMPHPVLHQP